ncbi:hypothetical protein AB7C87_03630 [Natrarchaeobius sp. A-rgal3]
MRSLEITFDDESAYERLQETKERHGLTWKGMLLRAQRELDSEDDR